MDGNLPSELIENILSRLPVESLIRFTSVCKSWRSTITSHRFIVAHHEQRKSSPPYTFIIPTNDERRFGEWIQIRRKEFHRLIMPVCPEVIAMGYHELCYCNGLILAHCGEAWERTYGVWNPSTRVCIKFKCPYGFSWYSDFHGLCYDPLVGDCKVVISNMKGYAIFDCVSNHWTEMKEINGIEPGHRFVRQGASSLSGDFYWIASWTTIDDPDDNENEIICFDAKEERFKNLSNPPIQERDLGLCEFLRLVSMGNHMCVRRMLCDYPEMIPGGETFQLKTDGGQYSWKNLNMDLDLPGTGLVYMHNENEFLFAGFTIQLYYREEQTFTVIEKDPQLSYVPPFIPFRGSLFCFR